MKIYTYILIITAFSFLTSCNNVKTIENIKLVDSLNKVLNNILEDQSKISFINMKLSYDTLKTDLDTITKYVTVIPANKKHKKYFTLYSDLRRDFKDLNKINIKEDIDYSVIQINSLEKDINTKAISIEQFYEYIIIEQTAISLLKKQNDYQLASSIKTLNNFTEYRPIITEMIDSAKAVYNN